MTLLLGFAAVNTGNNLLYLLVSALLGFMAVSGILGRENLSRLKIRVDLPDEIYAGIATLATVRLENRSSRWPRFLLRVTLEGSTALVPVLGGGAETRSRHHMLFTDRGTQTLRSVGLQSPFPVNFFVRRRSIPVARTLTVFPRPVPCDPSGAEGREKAAGSGGRGARVMRAKSAALPIIGEAIR